MAKFQLYPNSTPKECFTISLIMKAEIKRYALSVECIGVAVIRCLILWVASLTAQKTHRRNGYHKPFGGVFM